jgi:hypothetical protein
MKEIERTINERTILINEMKYEFSLFKKKIILYLLKKDIYFLFFY